MYVIIEVRAMKGGCLVEKDNKYSLSSEGVDRLMDRLVDIANSSATEGDGANYIGAEISEEFLKSMTKVESELEVINNNEDLTKRFKGFINMYGFDNMYDMYLYAKSCDSLKEKIKKNKDYSKLVPVKRKVTRGGKQHEITVWVKPDGDDEEENTQGQGDNTKGKTKRPNKKRTRNARDAKTEIIEADLEEVARLKAILDEIPKGDKAFKEDSRYYLELRDEGEIIGVVGYSDDGEYISMDFYRTNGEVAGVASRGFFKMLELAYEKGRGARIKDNPNAQHIFSQSGMTRKEDGNWEIKKEELEKIFGIGNREGNE